MHLPDIWRSLSSPIPTPTGGTAVQSAREQNRVLVRVAWRLLPLLGAAYVLAHLDRVNVSFAALTMNADLGFSESVYGLGAGLFFIGYLLFEIPSNVLLERVGARRLLATIMVVWGAVSMAMSVVQTPVQFYAMRFVLGLAEAGLFPGILLYLTYWFPDRQRAGAVGLFALALAVAGIFGSPLSGIILDAAHGWLGLRGWQWLFILEGLPTVLLAAALWHLLPDGPAQANWLSVDQRSWLRQAVAVAPAAGATPANWRARYAAASIWMPALVYFLFLGAFAGTLFWAPKLAHAIAPGLSSANIGLLIGGPYVAFAIGMVFWGRHSDRSGERHVHIAMGCLVAAGGYVLMALASNLTHMAAGLVLAMLGAGAAFSCFWSLAMSATSPAQRAVAIAVVNSAGALGSFASVYAVGRMYDATQDYVVAFLILAIAAAASGFAALATPGRVPRRVAGAGLAPDSGHP